jgi:phosphate/sulfate permease
MSPLAESRREAVFTRRQRAPEAREVDVFQLGLVILLGLAVSDLVVGVSNDAVNFLNSSIGARVASRRVILIVAGLGMMAGVTFSGGMMEVARKGIFHPQLFTMPELMVIFLAVMLADVIILDLYNTFGLPTSTTVSIVFELLGATVAVALIKLHASGGSYSDVAHYVNTSKALAIIFGILLSVGIAFVVGAVIQLLSRLLFTFDFERRVRRYGALWGGAALAAITFFILIKGAKGATFLTDEYTAWITSHNGTLLLLSFLASALLLQALLLLTRINVLKVVVLVGTFALAMAFSANDLVNFVGVPLAGLSAYRAASASGDPLGTSMAALAQPVRAHTTFLLLAGAIMVATLWISRKARGVTRTEVNLGRQEDGFERFESTMLSRAVVRVVASVFQVANVFLPASLKAAVARRMDRNHYRPTPGPDGAVPSFDLVRASVNLMVASALIAFATSLKLPLSTTYVTFMVAMGTSLSDQAWGRDSAVYRVTGVLTVIGGWFFTAMAAFTTSLLFAAAIYYGRAPVVIGLLVLAAALIARTHIVHRRRTAVEEEVEIFNLRKIRESAGAVDVTFEHTGIFLREVAAVLEDAAEGLFRYDRSRLRRATAGQRRIQRWSNIIAANIFKVLRLLEREDRIDSHKYAKTISSLQEISESVRDVVMRSHLHVANQHAGLLDSQIREVDHIRRQVAAILHQASQALLRHEALAPEALGRMVDDLEGFAHIYDRNQIERIQDNTSKTRLSILFYSFNWDALKIATQTRKLHKVFRDTLVVASAQARHQEAPTAEEVA